MRRPVEHQPTIIGGNRPAQGVVFEKVLDQFATTSSDVQGYRAVNHVTGYRRIRDVVDTGSSHRDQRSPAISSSVGFSDGTESPAGPVGRGARVGGFLDFSSAAATNVLLYS